MPDKKSRKHYSETFKREVVETMLRENLSYSEAARRFEVTGHHCVSDWEKSYFKDGLSCSQPYQERQREEKRIAKLDEQDAVPGADLVEENMRLRAENAYLKKLRALVLESEQHLGKKLK